MKKYSIRNFTQGIKNLIYWLPVIWKDRNWDGFYIYEILQHKIAAQSKHIAKGDIHTRAQQDARRMNVCVSLIKKCQEDFYEMEYMDYCETEFRFEDSEKEGFSELFIDDISENLDDYFKKYPLIYKRASKGEGPFSHEERDGDGKRVIAMNIASINQSRARKLLFKVMEDNLEKWWD